MAGLRIR
ncbi:hypothetical protein YPPY88_0932, partial [Yersinia pestis PY-88]